MRRRDFLLGGGSLFLAGCATQPREWSDVPWVGAAPPAAPSGGAAACAPPPPAPLRGAPPCAPPPPACVVPPAPAGGLRYVVMPGDSVASIAVRTGCPAGTIVATNRLGAGPLVPGQILVLPGVRTLGARSTACAPVAPPPVGGRGWTLVTRAQWGAQPLKGNHDPMGGVERITLHHTDEHDGMRGRSDADVVRSIQAYHRDTLGWADIGYHYLVGHDGRVYEGRAVSAQGAHSGGANNQRNLGISVIGNFSTHLPAPAQLAALRAFLADRQAAYRVGASGLLGHRDLSATECPGSALYGWLQDVRRGRA